MARANHSRRLDRMEEALTVLFCLIDDAYALLNPRPRCYEALKRLSDSEGITLALFQQLRGVKSERSFLRDMQDERRRFDEVLDELEQERQRVGKVLRQLVVTAAH